MQRNIKSALTSVLMIGLVLVWSISVTSPVQAKGGQGGARSHRGGGHRSGGSSRSSAAHSSRSHQSRAGRSRSGSHRNSASHSSRSHQSRAGRSRIRGSHSTSRSPHHGTESQSHRGTSRGHGTSHTGSEQRGDRPSGASHSGSVQFTGRGGHRGGGGHGGGGHGGGGHRGGGHRGGGGHFGGGHIGGGHRGVGHHGGHSSFYFSPYGFGYGYQSYGLGLYFGSPGYGYYDYYSRPYYSRPYYPYYDNYSNYGYDNGYDDGYVVAAPAPQAIIAGKGKAAEYQLKAEQAFRAHNYDEAVRFSNHAIIEDSENGKLHLFASQALFAVGDYRAAAGALQRGVSLLEQGDWGFVVENYKKFYRGNDYVTQMEKLVTYIKANPDAAYARLVRGYHYAFLGYKKAAQKELAKAVKLESRDRVAADLLVMVGGEVPSPSASEELPLPDATGPETPAAAARK